MASTEKILSAAQERAIIALLSRASVAEAVKAARVSSRTMSRWLSEDAFQTALRRARRDAFQLAVGLLAKHAGEAVGVLREIMRDKGAAPGARARCAIAILEHGRQSIEVDDLLARVEQLETKYRSDDDQWETD